ncbi:MAG: GTP pyrophosphokinase [Lewinellaceae bacterium]|nr:GTP pyrophosphokinase [Lewinellaceae bacterium]
MDKVDFFEKYKINEKDFKKTKLSWDDLHSIHDDYSKYLPRLESTAIFIFNSLMKIPGVHSVRYRIKNPEHLIEKIIRKKIENPKRSITLANYKNDVTDLIGLRALHLFKEDWRTIHKQIHAIWELKETPIAYHRKGDSDDYLEQFKSENCTSQEHKYGYRSIHYIIETNPTKETFIAEIQVRTIFEEAWSEIDHTIRYPYNKDHKVFKEFLMILNRLSGSADEMGTFIQTLQQEINSMEKRHIEQISERDSIISELEMEVKNITSKDKEISRLNEIIRKLKSDNTNILNPLTSLSSSFEAMRTSSGSLDISISSQVEFPQLELPKVEVPRINTFEKEDK